MKFLLDTHLLLWAAAADEASSEQRLPTEIRALLEDESHTLYFSAASVWEVAIKTALGRPEFHVNPHILRRALLDNGYVELPVTSEHGAGVAELPTHHKDPFDRLLIAQAAVEAILLLTTDERLGEYRMCPIRVVR